VSDRILRALVTGASAGIGRSIAIELAERGVDLVLVARREDRLTELAAALPGRIETLVADLGDPAGLASVAARLQRTDDPVDLLVNNAGFGTYAPVIEQSTAASRAMIDLNVHALTELTHAALAQFVPRGAGGIINVGSIAGLQPGPGAAVYGATKAYVHAFTEAVHDEVVDAGVHVMLLVPGITATEFHDRAGLDRDRLPGSAVMHPDDVARAALDAFAAKRVVCIPGGANRVTALGAKLAPTAVSRRVAALVHDRMQDR
jgi:uncharacterized protein